MKRGQPACAIAASMAWSRFIAISALLLTTRTAFALNPALDVSQYAHTSWKIRDGAFKGRIVAMAQTADGYLWLGTELGLVRFDGVRFVPWRPPANQSLPSSNIRGLLAARDGTLWIGTLEGVVSWKNGTLTTYQQLAGLGVLSMLEDRQGTLWISGRLVDAGRLCTVRDATVACHGDHGSLGGWAGSLYETADRVWVAADTGLWQWADESPRRYSLTRQAFYANLPPRSYRFRVIASNNSGVWNETGATLDFSVAPTYYQTTWFPALVAGMVLALAWGVHRVRLRIVEKHERQISALNERLMKAQEQERIRIAGELHDGVMQEMLAATMMLGTAKRRVASDADAKAAIDKVQEKLIRVGTDIRQLSHDLHPPLLQDAGLPEAVRSYSEQFAESSGIPVSCDVDDHARDLSRGAALALFRILQEALGNAAKHAHAKRITVRLTRSGDEVSLAVSDDGAGFDANRLAASGGLGLIMMRERASQLNGTFAFESAPGRGTTIKVVIPFR